MKNVDNPFQSPSILSLCPGFLGLERGLIRAIGKIRVAAYVEIEAFIIANLVAAMEQGVLAPAPIWSDIKTLNGSIFRGKIDGIIGGYPCQPFSHAGERKGTDDPRHLYPFISGIIKAAGPVWCFFENVAGHLTLGYPEVSADLRSMGYAVEAGIYSAEEVGAPHERDRLFILAIKQQYVAHMQDGGIWGLPECEPGQTRREQRNSINTNWGSEELENSGNAGMRRGNNEGIDRERKIQIEGSDKLGNIGIGNERDVCGGFRKITKEKPLTSNASSEMGNTTSPGHQERRFGTIGQLSEKERIGLYNRPKQSSVSRAAGVGQADPGGTGCERSEQHETPDERKHQQEPHGSATECSRSLWPARPGEDQYEWEELRVKSRLGSTVNGYNFREDLLRAYGNSVVEQTAEIAFIDLLIKHLNNQGTESLNVRRNEV